MLRYYYNFLNQKLSVRSLVDKLSDSLCYPHCNLFLIWRGALRSEVLPIGLDSALALYPLMYGPNQVSPLHCDFVYHCLKINDKDHLYHYATIVASNQSDSSS